jgi:hypothetical protein
MERLNEANLIAFSSAHSPSQKANFHTAQNRLSDFDALENQVVLEAFKSAAGFSTFRWQNKKKTWHNRERRKNTRR